MPNEPTAPLYRVWGADHIAYGPFELPALVTWIKQRKVSADTWLFLDEQNRWVKASEVAELKMFFKKAAATGDPATASATAGIKASNLRRIRIFAEMDDRQLESLLAYLEPVRIPKFTQLFRKGDPGDSMYFILEGEVRAMNLLDGKETTLFTMHPGDAFGEIALLIEGTRSADIVANEDSLLLKLPQTVFQAVIREAPALATPFLLAIARVITHRSLELGRKYEGSIRSARAVSEIHHL